MSPEPRRELPVPLRVEVTGPDGSASSEYAVNLSSGGVCLHVRRLLRPGDAIGLDFTLPPSGLRVAARARVVWTSAHGAEGSAARFWETGVRFVELDEELREALHRYASEAGEQRR